MQYLSRQLTKGIVMKTVGEFKKAGLVFVKGDVVDDSHDNDGSLMKPLSASMAVCCNEGKYKFNEASIESFAWRENTGVKPAFRGMIEIEWSDGSNSIQKSPYSAYWDIPGTECGIEVVKWRPSLNQPSVAEPDTKRSAIHKAWVALKGDLKNVRGLEGDDNVVVICLSKVGVFNVGDYSTSEWYVGGSNKHWKVICTIKEFTDYCEKMAAEEKRMKAIMQNGNDGLHYDNTAQQVEALALKRPPERMKVTLKEADDIGKGFVTRCVMMPTNPKFIDNETANAKVKSHIESLRPIFTQSMADANELPPVGSKITLFKKTHSKRIDEFLNEELIVIGLSNSIDGEPVITWEHEHHGVCCGIYLTEFFKPIDTRTDREKAIDAMLKDSRCNGSVIDICIERLYDAGYRKC